MYTRLWWKDARQFWPIWLFVALGAAASQWVALWYFSPQARQGVLCWMALVWTALYGVVTGAAAFAGEREMGTLRLLDILPAARGIVWNAKWSFALVSTLILGSLLMGMAATRTDRWVTDYFGPEQPLTPWLAACCVLIIPLAFSWALLWSSIVSNALTAAIAGIGSTGMCLVFNLIAVDERYRLGPRHVNESRDRSHFVYAMTELLVFLLVSVVSNFVFSRPSRRRSMSVRFQSPILFAPSIPPLTGVPSAQSDVQQPVRMAISQYAHPSIGVGSGPDQSSRRSWMPEAWRLAWETERQARKTWFATIVFGLLFPLLLIWAELNDTSLLMIINITIALVAGANVFGVENRGRTQRFLTHHGVRPGLVWFVKLTIWSLVIGLILAAQMTAIEKAMLMSTHGPTRDLWFNAMMSLPITFSVAVLCGMAITRGLSAVVMSLIFSIAVCVPHYLLLAARILPWFGFLVTPIVLIAVSWAWRFDWLLNRPAPGRWLRLSGQLAVAFAVLFGSYACYRAWSVPDLGPIAAPRAWLGHLEPVGERDAGSLYRLSFDTMKQSFPGSAGKLESYRPSLALIYEATALRTPPDVRQIKTLAAGPNAILDQLSALVILDARDRLARQDLAGVWNDLIALFRMTRHFSNGADVALAENAMRLERQALDLAMEWAIATRQSTEQLRIALTAFRELPPMASPDEILRAEFHQTEETINLPHEELKKALESIVNGSDQQRTGFLPAAWIDLLTTPWERIRALRTTRITGDWAIHKATDKLRLRLPVLNWPPADQQSYLRREYFHNTTPLAKMLDTDENLFLLMTDWNQTGRGALEQILAIRIWQFTHNGAFPDSLEKLVPAELPGLPLDPFSARPFRYKSSNEKAQVRLGKVLTSAAESDKVDTNRYRLLESVGETAYPNRQMFIDGVASPQSGIIFPIPPLQKTVEPKK